MTTHITLEYIIVAKCQDRRFSYSGSNVNYEGVVSAMVLRRAEEGGSL